MFDGTAPVAQARRWKIRRVCAFGTSRGVGAIDFGVTPGPLQIELGVSPSRDSPGDHMSSTTSSAAQKPSDVRWDPPGPGPWESERAHYPKAVPRFVQRAISEGFAGGFAESTARFGLLLSHFEVGFVNDFFFQQPAAFGAPKGAKGPPPKPVLWLLTRLHPAMRARIASGKQAFEKRLWVDDLKQWDDVDKPSAEKKHRSLLAVDLASLSDGALAKHLEACELHVAAMIRLHHRYTITACLPTGDFLAQTAEWTGKSAGEMLQLLRGSTPVSLGYSAKEMAALIDALDGDEGSREELARTRSAAETLAALQACPGAVGEAARAFVELVTHRAVGYDVGDKATGEMPELIVGAIRGALGGAGKAKPDAVSDRVKALRDLVPSEHRARFDALLEEARSINRLRDERGLYADCWAIGIARRALLEAGRRLTQRGQLGSPDHAVNLSLVELHAALVDKAGPSREEIDRRHAWRMSARIEDVPEFLGGTPAGPPPLSVLPPAAHRGVRAIDAVLSNLFKDTTRASEATIVRGMSVNEGSYEGTARVIHEASEFHRLQQGDVLVTRATAPYFNVVLPLLGALVTDRGGQLCHAAIVAREYGIPGVVGTKEATKLIPDGARVRVDGTSGEVHVLSAS